MHKLANFIINPIIDLFYVLKKSSNQTIRFNLSLFN